VHASTIVLWRAVVLVTVGVVAEGRERSSDFEELLACRCAHAPAEVDDTAGVQPPIKGEL
jgi:hypothetical protein